MDKMSMVQEATMQVDNAAKNTGDVVSIAILGLTWAEIVTPIATILTLVWMAFRAVNEGMILYYKLTGKKRNRRKEDVK